MDKEIQRSALLERYFHFNDVKRTISRWAVPFYIAALANLGAAAGALFGDNQDYRNFYGRNGSLGVVPIGVAVGIGIIGSRSQRRNAENIAVHIAELEGRIPSDPFAEYTRSTAVLSILTPLVEDLSVPRSNPRPYSKLTRALDNFGGKTTTVLQNLSFKDFEVRLGNLNVDPQVKNNLRGTTLSLGEEYWDQIASDPQQPDHRRRYAYQMIAGIRKRLN